MSTSVWLAHCGAGYGVCVSGGPSIGYINHEIRWDNSFTFKVLAIQHLIAERPPEKDS
jgi:hypothetical protein